MLDTAAWQVVMKRPRARRSSRAISMRGHESKRSTGTGGIESNGQSASDLTGDPGVIQGLLRRMHA